MVNNVYVISYDSDWTKTVGGTRDGHDAGIDPNHCESMSYTEYQFYTRGESPTNGKYHFGPKPACSRASKLNGGFNGPLK